MFTYSERDMHRMPSPLKTHLPIKPDIISSGIMEEDAAGRESEVEKKTAYTLSIRVLIDTEIIGRFFSFETSSACFTWHIRKGVLSVDQTGKCSDMGRVAKM